MKRIFICLFFLLLNCSLELFCQNYKGQDDGFWLSHVENLYRNGEYDEIVDFTTNYLIHQNTTYPYTKYSVDEFADLLFDVVASSDVNRRNNFINKLCKPIGEKAMRIYYLAASSFDIITYNYWNASESFEIDKVLQSERMRMSYNNMAYIFSELCYQSAKTDIAVFKSYEIPNQALVVKELYDIAITCKSKEIICGARYDEPTKELEKELRKIKAEAYKYVNSRKSSIFTSRTDEILYEITNKWDANKISKDHLPYVISKYRNMEFFESHDKKAIQKYEMDSLNRIIQYSQITMYYMSSADRKKITPLALDALIAKDIAELYTSGAKLYNLYRNTSWKDIQSKLQANEYAVQFFEATNGNEKWLLGYVISKDWNNPEVQYFGHSYRSERDAFGFFSKSFPNARNVYYVGLPNMEIQDAEQNNEKIHRLYSLAEICMPYVSKTNNRNNNLIIGNITYTKDENFAVSKGALSEDILGNFASDYKQMEYIASLFPQKCYKLGGDTINKSHFKKHIENKYNFVHISTHELYVSELEAFYNSMSPEDISTGINTNKSILLALADYNFSRNNHVSAYDISQMNLQSVGMVFISSCNSGSGRDKWNLQNIRTMSRAFHIAGVRNIIAFIGEVSVEDADKFTLEFYKYLSLGNSFHDSFHLAKKEVQNLANISGENAKVVLWE